MLVCTARGGNALLLLYVVLDPSAVSTRASVVTSPSVAATPAKDSEELLGLPAPSIPRTSGILRWKSLRPGHGGRTWMIQRSFSRCLVTWDRNDSKSGLANPTHTAHLSGLVLRCIEADFLKQILISNCSIFEHLTRFAHLSTTPNSTFAERSLSCKIS